MCLKNQQAVECLHRQITSKRLIIAFSSAVLENEDNKLHVLHLNWG